MLCQTQIWQQFSVLVLSKTTVNILHDRNSHVLERFKGTIIFSACLAIYSMTSSWTWVNLSSMIFLKQRHSLICNCSTRLEKMQRPLCEDERLITCFFCYWKLQETVLHSHQKLRSTVGEHPAAYRNMLVYINWSWIKYNIRHKRFNKIQANVWNLPLHFLKNTLTYFFEIIDKLSLATVHLLSFFESFSMLLLRAKRSYLHLPVQNTVY